MKTTLGVSNFGECEVTVTLKMSWLDLQLLATQLDGKLYPSYAVHRTLTEAISQFQHNTSAYLNLPQQDKPE